MIRAWQAWLILRQERKAERMFEDDQEYEWLGWVALVAILLALDAWRIGV